MEAETQPQTSTMEERFVWVLKHVYGDNQRRMSRDLDISQAAISRVIRGEQKAGRNLVAALATNARINQDWLTSGLGEPLVSARRRISPGGRMLPVASEILPGLPTEHPHLHSGLYFPVADEQSGDERYWLQVRDEAPVTRVGTWKVKAGDFLLMEADSRIWLDDIRFLDRKLGGIRLGGKGGPDLGLVEIRWDPGSGGLSYDDFGRDGDRRVHDEDPGQFRRLIRRRRRVVDTGDGPTPEETSIPPGGEAFARVPAPETAPVCLAIGDVVAVCLLLVRTS